MERREILKRRMVASAGAWYSSGDVFSAPYSGNFVNCDAPSPMRQMSSSYSLLLLCHSLACCILPCHHPHCIIMFSKLASVPVSLFSPLSVLSPHTLARARGTPEILF